MRRAGRKVFGAAWHHDPLAPGRHRVAWANNWVVLGVLVDLTNVVEHVAGVTFSLTLPDYARAWSGLGSGQRSVPMEAAIGW
jgi:hypothetical protein